MSDKSEYLYKIQPTRGDMLISGATSEEQRIVGDHYNYLKSLTDQDVVILAGRTQNTDERSFGIVIFRVDTEETARQIMENDPAVKRDVFRAELFPFRVSLMAKGA